MACFLVPTAEAIVVKTVQKVEEKKNPVNEAQAPEQVKVPLSQKLKWLSDMLMGGAVLLAFEHVWHGEVSPFFPFLTAMSSPEEASEMFHEMSTVGVGMAVCVTAAWVIMCAAADRIMKRRKADKVKAE